MSEPEQPKPCPFCGNAPDWYTATDGYQHIECRTPECVDVSVWGYGVRLIDRWNRRAPDRAASEPERCEVCEGSGYDLGAAVIDTLPPSSPACPACNGTCRKGER